MYSNIKNYQEDAVLTNEIQAIIKASELDNISIDKLKVHEAFYNMRGKCKLLSVNNVYFTEYYYEKDKPYSDRLENCFFNLEANGFLRWDINDRLYHIDKKVPLRINFDEEKNLEIQEMSKILIKTLKR